MATSFDRFSINTWVFAYRPYSLGRTGALKTEITGASITYLYGRHLECQPCYKPLNQRGHGEVLLRSWL